MRKFTWYIYAQDPDNEDDMLAIEESPEGVVPDCFVSCWILEHVIARGDLDLEEVNPISAEVLYNKLRNK